MEAGQILKRDTAFCLSIFGRFTIRNKNTIILALEQTVLDLMGLSLYHLLFFSEISRHTFNSPLLAISNLKNFL